MSLHLDLKNYPITDFFFFYEDNIQLEIREALKAFYTPSGADISNTVS